MKILFATALAGLVLSSGVLAQNGHFEFEDIPGISARPSVQIDLTPQMLNFVMAAAGANGDPQAAELLAGIERIRLRVYEQLEDAAAVMAFVDDTASALERQGWQPAVSVQDGEERVRMYMQFDGDRVAGMTVMVVEPSEAVFINIAGTIDPVMLGTLTRQMGLGNVLGGMGAAIAGAGQAADAPGPGDGSKSADADD